MMKMIWWIFLGPLKSSPNTFFELPHIGMILYYEEKWPPHSSWDTILPSLSFFLSPKVLPPLLTSQSLTFNKLYAFSKFVFILKIKFGIHGNWSGDRVKFLISCFYKLFWKLNSKQNNYINKWFTSFCKHVYKCQCHEISSNKHIPNNPLWFLIEILSKSLSHVWIRESTILKIQSLQR